MESDSTSQMNQQSLLRQPLASIPQSSRYLSLDLLRGVAIMGILLMNIQSFGNVFASYVNPTVNGEFSGLNMITWITTYTFAQEKFYTIFSILFGAGIVLMAESVERKGFSPAESHYRRAFFLLVIGLLHVAFIWWGDILSTYAMASFVVYFLWRLAPSIQILIGGLLILLVPLYAPYEYSNMTIENSILLNEGFNPSRDSIAAITMSYLGTWSGSLNAESAYIKATTFDALVIFRIMGAMVLGMGLYRSGILTASKSKAYYKRMTLTFLPVGVLISLTGALVSIKFGFKDGPLYSLLIAQFSYFGSALMAIGYIALINLWFKGDGQRGIKLRIQAMGKMALTNYLSQSIICTTIFYGFGLGLFGSLERYELMLVAVAVIAAQFMWSKTWLEYFKIGPLEWVLRTLTYMKWQPIRIKS